MLDIWNILITDSGDIATNADRLLTKSAQLRPLKVLFDWNYFQIIFILGGSR
jgi:hypothetical protein